MVGSKVTFLEVATFKSCTTYDPPRIVAAVAQI